MYWYICFGFSLYKIAVIEKLLLCTQRIEIMKNSLFYNGKLFILVLEILQLLIIGYILKQRILIKFLYTNRGRGYIITR